MKYMGSKSRIAKNIIPIIQKYIYDNNIVHYYEPFCGGCNIIDKIKCESKYANDNQKISYSTASKLRENKQPTRFCDQRALFRG